MNETDVGIVLRRCSGEILLAKNTKEVRKIVANLKKELDLRRIFFEGHCGVCKWKEKENDDESKIPYRRLNCEKHNRIVKDVLVCYEFMPEDGNQTEI